MLLWDIILYISICKSLQLLKRCWIIFSYCNRLKPPTTVQSLLRPNSKVRNNWFLNFCQRCLTKPREKVHHLFIKGILPPLKHSWYNLWFQFVNFDSFASFGCGECTLLRGTESIAYSWCRCCCYWGDILSVVAVVVKSLLFDSSLLECPNEVLESRNTNPLEGRFLCS